MPTVIGLIAIVLCLVILAVLILLFRRSVMSGGRQVESALRDELRLSREESARQGRELREEVSCAQVKANELVAKSIDRADAGLRTIQAALDEKLRLGLEDQRKHLAEVIQALKNLEGVHQQEQTKARDILDRKFAQIQESNEKKLEAMRQTVDEKLQSTLEKRLGESFKQVSDRLESVHRGLGEMQTLATGVGDLKRVLTNVKERGTWGEAQLGNILSDILTPDQYSRNVRIKDNRESVEFAVKLPGNSSDPGNPLWLPIDSKFPREDFDRLVDASNLADAEGVKEATAALMRSVTKMARDIHDKYIHPPVSTDFAILFLPTESLYAEILRQPGFHNSLQQNYRVLVAGPTTLSAILNSLRVGFQTLVIEQRAHEVWTVLAAVKTEFGKFGGVLDKVRKQLNTASKTIDESSQRTRAMARALQNVQQLPGDETQAVLGFSEPLAGMDAEGDDSDTSDDG